MPASPRPAQPLPTKRQPSWTFFRAGNVDQVVLQSGEDLKNLSQLDQKLWVALSCPVKGLEFDEATLALIDTDRDGTVRIPELLAAIDWASKRLTDLDALVDGNQNLALDKIATDTAQGKSILNAAKAILQNLGKADSTTISVAETSQRTEIFSKAAFNGDGIVPASSAPDPKLSQAIADIVACTGGKRDRGGEMGVDNATLATFYDELERYSQWSQTDSPEETPVGFEAYRKIKDKIDDYFSRCQLVAYDPRAAEPLNHNTDEFAAIGEDDLSSLPESLRALPLAPPTADLQLDLDGPINPAWSQDLAGFRAVVLEKLDYADRSRLSFQRWREISERFSTVEARHKELHDFSVRQLPATRIQELLEQDYRPRLEALIAQDRELADEVAAVDDLDRLVRYQRDLHQIARNFVNFADFFSFERSAIFQAGTLYIDSRGCNLCVRVANPIAHSTLASLSRCYLIYCECARAGETPIHIAAVLSNGGSDHLMVGRNGVFYDRDGKDWHARVVKIVENPISIRQAFWSPYKKFAKFLDTQISKRAEAAENAVTERLATTSSAVAQADKKAPEKKSAQINVGTVAAIGVAVGSIGTFVSMLLIRAISLGPWLPLALLAVVLMISLPSMFLAWIRLRQRTLGPILDANGWAVNGQISINTHLARTLTTIRKLPKNSKRSTKLSSQNGHKGGLFLFVIITAALAATFLAAYLYQSGKWTPAWKEKTVVEETMADPTR
ncbi:hypothetical protein [Pelagicoccus sp. SDUM812005]|uniref:hypothetical protein n=1 Tax=Pelagicoccus sp. SDUM812005 TaxID=3041257 RepID=UPI00280D216E|nr:hypothetical protein [Pelagicoccus sp. SDUM812005]MDQ8182775.1 hypothetical protein [Pelagicoccus sp. SDUM812005]